MLCTRNRRSLPVFPCCESISTQSSRDLRAELVAKDKELLRLRRAHDLLEAAVGSGSAEDQAAVREAERLGGDNARLRLKVAEMEAFLRDYGLVWKGGTEVERPPQSGVGGLGSTGCAGGAGCVGGAGGAGGCGAGQGAAPDFDLLFAKIKELNGIMDAAGAKVIKFGQKCVCGLKVLYTCLLDAATITHDLPLLVHSRPKGHVSVRRREHPRYLLRGRHGRAVRAFSPLRRQGRYELHQRRPRRVPAPTPVAHARRQRALLMY